MTQRIIRVFLTWNFTKFKKTYSDSRQFFINLARNNKRLLIKKQFNYPEEFIIKVN